MNKYSLLVAVLLCVPSVMAQQTAGERYLGTEPNGVRVYESRGYTNTVNTPAQQEQEEAPHTPRQNEDYNLEEVEDVLVFCEMKLAEAQERADTEAMALYESDRE